MPGMALHFLRNPAQRMATGKAMPTKQVEAVLLYGRPEQRAKVVERMLDSGLYALALNKTTQHMVLSLLDKCDNLVRVRVLYVLRRKLLDLSQSAVGNTVVQHLLDRLPRRQRAEVAECFTRNVDEHEFVRLCEHAYGNHVAQRLIELPECAAVVEPALLPQLSRLAAHAYGARVVAKYIAVVEDGWRRAAAVLFAGVDVDALVELQQQQPQPQPHEAAAEDDGSSEEKKQQQRSGGTAGDDDNNDDDEAKAKAALSDAVDAAVAALFAQHDDSLVLDALLRHALVPLAIKDAIAAHACEYVCEYLTPSQAKAQEDEGVQDGKTHTDATTTTTATGRKPFALPNFGQPTGATRRQSGSTAAAAAATSVVRHVHTYCTLLERGDDAQRALVWDALQTSVPLTHAQQQHEQVPPLQHSSPRKSKGNKTATTTTTATSATAATTTTHTVRVYELLLRQSATIAVLIAAVKHYPPCRAVLFDALFTADDDDDAAVQSTHTAANASATTRNSSNNSDANAPAADDNNVASSSRTSSSPTRRRVLRVAEVASSAVRTLLLRAFIDVDVSRLSLPLRAELCGAATARTLAVRATASPVLQRLVEADVEGGCAALLCAAVRGHAAALSRDACGCFLIQALLQHPGTDAARAALVRELLDGCSSSNDNTNSNSNSSDPTQHEALFADLRAALSHAPCSRVMQRLLAYADDDAVCTVADRLLQRAATAAATTAAATRQDNNSKEEGEEKADDEDGAHDNTKDDAVAATAAAPTARARRADNRSRHYDIDSDALVSYALHQHACYVVQALLRETRQRQLDSRYKLLMQALKPHVFDLAVSPWAGRVVLETMLTVGSVQLAHAMREVVFLRAEQWLSEAPGSTNKRVLIAATRGAAAAATASSSSRKQQQQQPRTQRDKRSRNDDGGSSGSAVAVRAQKRSRHADK